MSGQALTYIEIDVPYCALTYGVAPCTASLVSSPPTGTAKCFNTRATCQDIANIDLQDVTLRFAKGAAYRPKDIDIIEASVLDVEFSPAVVSLGENLGQRSSVKVVFRDHKHSDAGEGLDKYHDERGYDPYEQGSFWGRFRARHQFLRGQPLRWINGFVGDVLADMETRHFFIESVEGPTPDGKFTIVAKDCLKFLDGDRAQAPVLSNGFLNAGIDDNDTSATLSPTGIGNDEYPASGYVCLGGKEVCSFTRSGDTLTLTRAQRGTTAQAHSAQDRAQLCVVYDADDPADIINDLLTNYTDLPASYIPLSTWQAETEAHLNRVFTFTIVEPTPVAELISRLIVQATLALWDDNVNQQLRLQVLRAIPTNADEYSEANVIAGSFKVTEQPDKKVTQVWVYFGQIDPTKRYDDPDNYRASAKVPEVPDEVAGEAVAIKKIFANGIPLTGGRTIAERIGEIHEGRYRTAPRRFGFDLMRGSVDAPVLGGGYQLNWHTLQDAAGAREDVPIQGIRLKPTAGLYSFEAEEMRFDAPVEEEGVFPITLDVSQNNINLLTVFTSLYGTPQTGDEVNVTINSGVIIGSTSTLVPALDVDDGWPSGVVITITNNGRIQGEGGNGGTGAPPAGSGSTGQAGGLAFSVPYAITLDNTDGEIFGGGGGGGGGGRGGGSGGGGGGGGGGAGTNVGTGGAAGSGGNPGSPGTSEAGGAGGTSPVGGTGGSGGGPGLAGSNGTGPGPGVGGAAGTAIDGISNVTVSAAGDIRGAQIN